MSNLAVIEKLDGVAGNSKNRFMQALVQALPQQSIILAPALVRQAITIIKSSESLQRATEYSIFTSIAEVAQAGLSLDLHLGQCYLVPFSNVCTVLYGYRGLIELARRSGEVNEIVGEIRYEKDQFSLTLGSERRLTHIPADLPESKRGERLGAYAIADMARSRPVFEYMSADQILRVKGAVIRRAKGKQTVWETENENEMWRKTPIRRLAKRLPQSPALIPFIQAAIRDEYRQAGVHQVVEMPALVNGGGESVPMVEILREEKVTEEPIQKAARESNVKEKKADPKAKITKEQSHQLYTLLADLNLESTDMRKCLDAVGHKAALPDLPANLFAALAEALQKRASR